MSFLLTHRGIYLLLAKKLVKSVVDQFIKRRGIRLGRLFRLFGRCWGIAATVVVIPTLALTSVVFAILALAAILGGFPRGGRGPVSYTHLTLPTTPYV